MTRVLLLAAILLAGCASQLELRRLTAVNEVAKLAPGDCQDHVRAVQVALAGRYDVDILWSRSPWMRTAHVSALVTTDAGTYVLDNGALGQGGGVFLLQDMRGSFTTKVIPKE